MIEACGNLVATREGVIGLVLLTALASAMVFGAFGYVLGAAVVSLEKHKRGAPR